MLTGPYTYRKAFNSPYAGATFGSIFAATDCCLKLWAISIHRYWDNNFNIVSCRAALKLRAGFYLYPEFKCIQLRLAFYILSRKSNKNEILKKLDLLIRMLLCSV